jgi:Domain of unknown function (DUF4386)
MNNRIDAGRLIGALMLLQIPGGIVGNFVLSAPVIAPPGFLVNAAAHPLHVTFSVLLGLGVSALGLGIAIAAFQVIRGRAESLALWLIGLSVANFTLAAVEQIAMMSLLSLSQAYTSATAPDEAMFQALRGVVAAARNWAHYIHLLIGGGTILVLFAALFRLALVPRALAGAGAVASLLQMTAVAMPLFGYPVSFPLLAPLGFVMLATAGWLIVKGFGVRATVPA